MRSYDRRLWRAHRMTRMIKSDSWNVIRIQRSKYNESILGDQQTSIQSCGWPSYQTLPSQISCRSSENHKCWRWAKIRWKPTQEWHTSKNLQVSGMNEVDFTFCLTLWYLGILFVAPQLIKQIQNGIFEISYKANNHTYLGIKNLYGVILLK